MINKDESNKPKTDLNNTTHANTLVYSNENKIVMKLSLDKQSIGNEYVNILGKTYSVTQLFAKAINGVTGARLQVADYYFNGKFVNSDKDFAIKIIENEFGKSTHDNFPVEYVYALGTYYEANSNYNKAISLYKSPVLEPFPPAISRIAQMYKMGNGVERSMSLYERYLLKAKSMGHIKSKSLLGQHYLKNGNFLKKTLGLFILFSAILCAIWFAVFQKKDVNQMV